MSSLPSLSLGSKAPFSMEEFLALCKGNVSEADYMSLCKGTSGCEFSRKWDCFYSSFLTELCNQRRRVHLVAVEAASETDVGISSVVSQAIAMSSGDAVTRDPLAAELLMIKFLYGRADEMVGLSQFDQNALFGYQVKLRLLSRKDEFSALDGKAEYQRLFSNMQSIIFDTSNKLE